METQRIDNIFKNKANLVFNEELGNENNNYPVWKNSNNKYLFSYKILNNIKRHNNTMKNNIKNNSIML